MSDNSLCSVSAGRTRSWPRAWVVGAVIAALLILTAAGVVLSRRPLPVEIERQRLAAQFRLSTEQLRLQQEGWAIVWGPWRGWKVQWASDAFGELWTDGRKVSQLFLRGRAAHVTVPRSGDLRLRDADLVVTSITPGPGTKPPDLARTRTLAVAAIGALLGAEVVAEDGTSWAPRLSWPETDPDRDGRERRFGVECEIVGARRSLPRRLVVSLGPETGQVRSLRVVRW